VPAVGRIQHFGPLLVIASQDEVPDPELTARSLLDGGASEKLGALESLGLNTDPEIKRLWLEFLHTHKDVAPSDFLKSAISTGVPSLFRGEGESSQKLISTGLDTLSDAPFYLDAIFTHRNGIWFRVATIACRCKLMEVTEPAKSIANKRTNALEELVYRIDMSPENDFEWHLREVRFRLRQDLLRPVIQYEAESWKCPHGYKSGHLCTGIFGNFTSSTLIDDAGKSHIGAVLFSGTQTSRLQDKELARRQMAACTAYAWNEEDFVYEESSWKAKACNGHSSWSRNP
jgi:hypothetical protein